jgi:hypothetical protein
MSLLVPSYTYIHPRYKLLDLRFRIHAESTTKINVRINFDIFGFVVNMAKWDEFGIHVEVVRHLSSTSPIPAWSLIKY